MYRGHFKVILDEEEISKIEGMLTEKWNVSEIVIENRGTYWYISFVTDDRKKVFGLLRVIRTYGGRVLNQWIDKVSR